MHYTTEDLQSLDRIKRLNLVNSISGPRPAALIGTKSKTGISNLAIFNSITHIGSNPPLVGFILRPDEEVRRHTMENIEAQGFYTINYLPDNKTRDGHYTSAKFESDQSEFEKCNFREEFIENFNAPFVSEAPLKLGMKYVQSIPIEINGTRLVIGQVEHLSVPDEAVDKEGHIDMATLNIASVSGLNTYYSLKKIEVYPYARPGEIHSK